MNINLLTLIFLVSACAYTSETTTQLNGVSLSLTNDSEYVRVSIPREGHIFASFSTPEITPWPDDVFPVSVPCEISILIFKNSDDFLASQTKTYKQNPAYEVTEEKVGDIITWILKDKNDDGMYKRFRQYLPHGDNWVIVDIGWHSMKGYPKKLKSDLDTAFRKAVSTIKINGKGYNAKKYLK